ncbi:hypothetical protein QYE76_059675 [Lolium multiflorum]|uniref:Uncharacterized protein n=1 Tax=Lolium multiflorum TaxID=4521 RepID=A0AAD8W4P2_LOLMU|nr:hypothetical protein QYE76_059675 [Lolium multiflorum]
MAEETPVTVEELTGELKKKYDEVKSALEADLIGSFHRTRSHGIGWKGFTRRRARWSGPIHPSKNAPGRTRRPQVSYGARAERKAIRKWHNTFTHTTNDCRVWRQQIQVAIENGRLIFNQYAMKVDTHPFPAVNMVEFTHLGGCQPDFSANISMVELGHHSEKDGDEDSCSQSKDTRGPLHAIGSVKMTSATANCSQKEICGVHCPVCSAGPILEVLIYGPSLPSSSPSSLPSALLPAGSSSLQWPPRALIVFIFSDSVVLVAVEV